MATCTHPDHVDGVSCLDRAVGCAPDCACCLAPETIAHYAAQEIVGTLAALSDTQREQILTELRNVYCFECGRTQPLPPARRCQCSNFA